MLVDSHTHLFVEQFNEDREQVIARAIDAGISKLLLPNIDVESISSMLDLAKKYPKNCFPMMGLHPGAVDQNWQNSLDIIHTHLLSGNFIAVGEIGMDLYWDKTFVEEQRIAFRKQVQWAKELKLPVAIHAREAFDEIFTILDEEYDDRLSGVFHCFTGTREQAVKAMGYDRFMFGIGGVVTYKKAQLEDVLIHIPLERIVLETDSPYLTPVPFRGKRNESSYLIHIAERVADIYSLPLKKIEDQTTENAVRLFNLTI